MKPKTLQRLNAREPNAVGLYLTGVAISNQSDGVIREVKLLGSQSMLSKQTRNEVPLQPADVLSSDFTI